MDKLLALGFTCTGGQIDRENVNYGFLTADGPVLTPEGEALVKSLTKKGRKSVEEVVSEVVASPDTPV
jgi:hypothetical protein